MWALPVSTAIAASSVQHSWWAPSGGPYRENMWSHTQTVSAPSPSALREAVRSLAQMGFSLGAASALLAACGGSTTPSPTAAVTPRPTPTPHGAGSVPPAQAITFPGPARTLQGAWAGAASPRGGVLVIHE